MKLPNANRATFFQQKWAAKSLTRAYHGEQIREGQWTRMFDRRLPAVVPMDYRKMARSDGEDAAAGRGAGESPRPSHWPKLIDPITGEPIPVKRDTPENTPYMHMTYWPTERRLDTAIFRSLFASSTRQARQFVVHGFVKVNGKKMPYPGYLLNPGDLFQVDPERVLWATGARKHNKNNPETRQGFNKDDDDDAARRAKSDPDVDENNDNDTANKFDQAAATRAEAAEEAALDAKAFQKNPKAAIQALMRQAKAIVDEGKNTLSAKRKQDLRAFAQTAKKALSQIRGTKTTHQSMNLPIEETIDGLTEALESINLKIDASSPSATAAVVETTSTTTPTENTASSPSSSSSPESTPTPSPSSSKNPQSESNTGKPDAYVARADALLLHAALQRAQANPIDVRKPYATPWQPREFMSAFAFIPRYLEVNQNICSAVYLRHPVARPGLAEVPTPVCQESSALAFNWYLRRR